MLIDFGSARQALGEATQAMTTIVTPGYAPFEQYTQTTKQGPWTDVYALAGVLYFAVTGQNPPDAIARMKDDGVAQALGTARLRYSGPFIDAIAWGLAIDDAARARSIAELRDALFGKQIPAAVQAAAASGLTVKTTAIGPAAARAAQAAGRTQQIQSAEARANALAAIALRREQLEPRSRLPLGWIGFGVVAVLILFFGLRMIGSDRKPATPAKPAPVAVEPANVASPSATPGSLSAPTEQAAATPATSLQPTPTSVPPANSFPAPGVSPGAVISDTGLSLSREQFIQAYPHLADRFSSIDTNHDGRISPNELVDGIQQSPAR